MASIAQNAAEAGVVTMQTKIAYTASAATGTASILTFNEVIGAVGVLGSILFAGFTAWSNHKKNKLQMQVLQAELDNKRNKGLYGKREGEK